MKDLIFRQTAIDALDELCERVCDYGEKHRSVMCVSCPLGSAFNTLEHLPSAQAEPLTDSEKRIFLAAIGREKQICKRVDNECGEIELVPMCNEIIRKVKDTLWTK